MSKKKITDSPEYIRIMTQVVYFIYLFIAGAVTNFTSLEDYSQGSVFWFVVNMFLLIIFIPIFGSYRLSDSSWSKTMNYIGIEAKFFIKELPNILQIIAIPIVFSYLLANLAITFTTMVVSSVLVISYLNVKRKTEIIDHHKMSSKDNLILRTLEVIPYTLLTLTVMVISVTAFYTQVG